jgi:glycosyltransferase involved in cell wall biosynthesis
VTRDRWQVARKNNPSRLRVILEAELLGSQKHIGISNSIFQLATVLSTHDITLTIQHKNREAFFKDQVNILEEPATCHLPPATEYDLVHTFTMNLPRNRNLPWILTVFDTITEVYPEVLQEVYPKLSGPAVDILRKNLHAVVKRADRLIAISDNTKKDIVKYYGIAENKIEVIPLAPLPCFQEVPSAERTRFLERQKIDVPFFLFVGPRWKHKNFPALLKAFGLFRKMDEKNKALRLFAVGSSPVWTDEETRLIGSAGLGGQVRAIPYVSAAELNLWYNTATALVYPSLYEGFGLPPLEAMSCGLPVLASGRSSIPEVTGEAALLYDPERPEEIAELLKKIVYDTSLREKQKEQGKYQAKKFSWEKIVKQTLEVYAATAARQIFHRTDRDDQPLQL